MMANYPYYNPYLQNGYQYASAPAQNQNSIIWVNGDKEASAYPVAPNNAVALWDSENPTIYLKQADASGRPSNKSRYHCGHEVVVGHEGRSGGNQKRRLRSCRKEKKEGRRR